MILGYGFFITAVASLKLAMRKGKPLLFIDYIKGFWKAKSENKNRNRKEENKMQCFDAIFCLKQKLLPSNLGGTHDTQLQK